MNIEPKIVFCFCFCQHVFLTATYPRCVPAAASPLNRPTHIPIGQYLRYVVARQHFTSYLKLHAMLRDMEALYLHILRVSMPPELNEFPLIMGYIHSNKTRGTSEVYCRMVAYMGFPTSSCLVVAFLLLSFLPFYFA